MQSPPCRSIVMWPKCPAIPAVPCKITPSTMAAPPTPVPKVSKTTLRRPRVVVGADGQIVTHQLAQKFSFQKVQIARQAIYPRGLGVNNSFAAYPDSPQRCLRLLQRGMNEAVQGFSGPRRWCLKAFEQVSARTYNCSFDRRGADVNAQRQRSFISTRTSLAHSDCALYATCAILLSAMQLDQSAATAPHLE